MIRIPCRLAALLMTAPAALAFAPVTAIYAQAQSPGEQLAAASALFDAGKYAEAAKTLDAFLAANPGHARAGAAALALGRCRSELKQYAKAVPAYEKAIASHDPAVTTTAELGLGEAALQTGQWAKAASALSAATKAGLTPEQSPVAYGWLGQANYQAGKYAPAEEAYNQVIQKYPNSDGIADAYFGAGLSALKLDKADSARHDLRVVADRFATSENRPQALLLLGQMDLDAKQDAQARDEFQGVLSATGVDADTRQAAEDGLVNTLLNLKDYAGAASHLQAILTKLAPTDPQRFPAQLTLGRSLYLQKQYAPAEAAYKVAAKATDPKVAAQGLYWSANSALSLNHPAEAATLFAQVASRFPASELAVKAKAKVAELKADARQNSTDETMRQARTDLDSKKYAESAASLTTLLATAPPADISAEAHYLLGLADQGLNKAAPAITALSAAVQAAPTADWVPDAQVQMAWLNIELKHPALAETSARAALALSIDPGYSPAIEQQSRLALVQADLDQQKWDDALANCQTLMAGNPSPDVQATVLFTQAWISEKQNKSDAAQPLWLRLATDFPKSQYAPDALLHVGDAAFAAQKYDDALTRYSALVTNYPASADIPQARLGLGNTLYSLNQYNAAAQAFDALAADKNVGDLKPEALYWAGASLEKAGKKAEAIQRLTRLVGEFPASARVANAKIRLAGLKAGN